MNQFMPSTLGWHSIEDAPKDGTPIRTTTYTWSLVLMEYHSVMAFSVMAFYQNDRWCLYCPDDHLHGSSFEPQPTHWRKQ